MPLQPVSVTIAHTERPGISDTVVRHTQAVLRIGEAGSFS